MRPSLLKETIKALFPIQRTICLEGSPGGGKTTLIRDVAKELDVMYIERHTPTALVEDFGIPWPMEGDTFDFKTPAWFPVAGKAPDKGVLCFDDRNGAATDIQKVLANVCQARTLHGVKLPPEWMVVSTGNRQRDRSGANRVLAHLRNRETVLEWDTHLEDWTEWALGNDVQDVVISFMRFRTGLLHDFDPQADQNPTPRAWVEGVSDILGTVPPEAEYECFKGAVGEGAAAEFVGYLKIHRSLPNPDSILLNPDSAVVPTDPATLYALAGSLAERASTANFDRLVTYAERMPPEFSVLTVSFASRRDRELASTAAFTKWAVAHQDVLM